MSSARPDALHALLADLASFAPERRPLSDAPWESYLPLAMGHGLAPLAAYNLEYRLGRVGAPTPVRDRLLSVYQGLLNDNVMKLVQLKRLLDGVEGAKVVLLGAASNAETLYPHVAFRPVVDIDLWVRPGDLARLEAALQGYGLEAGDAERWEGQGLDVRVYADGRTRLRVCTRLTRSEAVDAGLLERALPAPAYGPSSFRLELEDALLVACQEHARSGYEVPLISFVDVRELVTGARMLAGPLSRPPELSVVRARASELGLSRALYASLEICARLFPEAADAARAGQPTLRRASKALVDRWVVEPLASLTGRGLRGTDRLRRLLSGGHGTFAGSAGVARVVRDR